MKKLEETYAVGVASLTERAWEQAIAAFEKIIGIDAYYRDAKDLLRKAEQGRWDDWKSRMLSSLQASGKLTANSLDYVPKQLRLDTMRGFYEEHSENLELVPSTDFQVLALRNFDLVLDLRETWRAMLRAIQSEQADVEEGEPTFWAQLKRDVLLRLKPTRSFDILADELTDQLCSVLGFVRTPDQDRQHKRLYVRMISTPTLHYKLPPRSPLIILAKQSIETQDVRDLFDLMHILGHTIGFLVTLGNADQLKMLLDQEGAKRDFVVLSRHDLEQILLSRDKAARLTQATLERVSLTVISPYRAAGPVPARMFFGRKKEIRWIRDVIRDTNVALTGGRRIGKTSMLRRVQSILTTELDYKTLYLDCQAIDTYEIFNRKFTEKLSDQFERPQTFRQAIETMRDAEDKLIVVLLDEVDDLLQHDVEQQGERLFKELRSLSQEGHCSFIFSGGKALYKRIHSPDSPFFNFCHNIMLGFLNEESATEIIIHPMNGMGIELQDQDELVARILRVSSCHPNIVQLICKKLVENIKGRTIGLDDLHAVVTSEDFYTDFKKIAWGQATPLEKIVSLVFVEDEDFTSREVYQRLAEFGIEDRDAIEDTLDTLELYSLITKRGKRYEYALREFPRVFRETEDIEILIDSLARQLGIESPEYTRIRDFFTQARFHTEELGAEQFLLSPQGQDHPQLLYGPVYARLIFGRPLTGDDFTAVCQAAQGLYGDDMAHRVAIVISDQRPEPGARYRLYEIRQREGLAIVFLDSALFGQIKPNRTASDILAAEIDQATGQQNLYAISGPVSGDLSFFGRERVLQEVIDLLNAGQPVGIFGLRKVGKTSLIQRLQGRLAQRRPIAFVDTQSTVRQRGMWPLYSAIIALFVTHLQRYYPGLDLPDLHLWPGARSLSTLIAESFLEDLHTLHAALGQPSEDERMLLIVDEIERLLPSGSTLGYDGFATFFGQLRAANQHERILDFLIVGVDPTINRRERWQDYDNELYRALREVWMPPMAPDDIQEMIESLGSHMGVRYEAGALEMLTKAGGGQPFVTRQICSLAVEGRLGRGAITVTASQARTAIEEFVFQPDSYLAELWRTRLDNSQQEMLRALALSPVPPPRTQLLPAAQRQEALSALGSLEEYTLVLHGEGGYVIAWDVFRNWIRWVELGLEE